MLIGAHVSTSGGLPKAVERGVETGSTAIQIFNQSPRMWRPTKYTEDDFKAFRAAMDDSPVDAVVIHAIYLINPGTRDPEMKAKALPALAHALRVGDGIGAAGVVLHPGPVMKGEEYGPTTERIAEFCKEALADSDECKLLLENAAGANAVGGKFEHLHDLIELLDGDARVGVCIDSCHSHAANVRLQHRTRGGSPIRPPPSATCDRSAHAASRGRLRRSIPSAGRNAAHGNQ